MFDQKPRAAKNFRDVDVDKDGFISYKDLENCLIKTKIQATQQEVKDLMEHVLLDPQSNGFIDLPEFTKKFG